MNPGSSGSPLLNVRGEVVGINVAMLADEIGGGRGIGFAVPINDVKALLPQLRAGKVVRGRIGVRFRQDAITDDDATALGLPKATGALITSVEAGSAADAAGLRCGDVIVNFAGAPVASADDLLARVSAAPPGSLVVAIVVRDGRMSTVNWKWRSFLSTVPERAAPPVEESLNFGLSLRRRRGWPPRPGCGGREPGGTGGNRGGRHRPESEPAARPHGRGGRRASCSAFRPGARPSCSSGVTDANCSWKCNETEGVADVEARFRRLVCLAHDRDRERGAARRPCSSRASEKHGGSSSAQSPCRRPSSCWLFARLAGCALEPGARRGPSASSGSD